MPHSPDHTETQPAASFADDILAGIEQAAPISRTEEIECDIAPKELPAGTDLHGYRILKPLGAGGFGITYLAEEDYLSRRVVIKESFPDSLCYRQTKTLHVCLNDPDNGAANYDWARGNFLREARILASLDHPYIAKVYSYFEANNTAYYVTEYIDGLSLGELADDYARSGHPLSQDALLGLMVRMLDALDYMHNKQLLHRDIKPDNILINQSGLPILIDFGAARESYGDLTPTFVESQGFTPPEQLKADGTPGPWSDLYALGATFYYALKGKCLPPCHQREIFDKAEPLASDPQLLALYAPAILRSIDKACRPLAEERYADAAAWLADLNESALAPASAQEIANASLPRA